MALKKLNATRLSNKVRFDKIHHLKSNSIEVGDWRLIFDSSLEYQCSTLKKFIQRWFRPYIIVGVHENATYLLCELDGMILKISMAKK